MRASFKLAALSSTIKIDSPAIGSSSPTLPGRAREIPAQGVEYPVASAVGLRHDALRRGEQSLSLRLAQIFDRPYDDRHAAHRWHRAEALDEIEAVRLWQDHVEHDDGGAPPL